MNYDKIRFKRMCLGMGWSLKDISDITGYAYRTVKIYTTFRMEKKFEKIEPAVELFEKTKRRMPKKIPIVKPLIKGWQNLELAVKERV